MSSYQFISGLPRSGSTLLSALLLQNPRFHAGMTSPVGSLLGQFSAGSEFAPLTDQALRRLLHGLFDNYYADQTDKSVVFDTNRMWSAKLPALLNLFQLYSGLSFWNDGAGSAAHAPRAKSEESGALR